LLINVDVSASTGAEGSYQLPHIYDILRPKTERRTAIIQTVSTKEGSSRSRNVNINQ